MDPGSLPIVARHVMRLLVEHRFDELEEASNGVRLAASEMRSTVEDLGRPLVMPPEASWTKLDATAIRNWPGAYSIKMDLWTSHGRSDLSIELTIHTRNGKPVIEVDDIHPR